MSLPAIKHRLLSGFSIAGVLFAAFFYMPDGGIPFVLAALAAVMALEFDQMMSAGGVANFRRRTIRIRCAPSAGRCSASSTWACCGTS